MRERYSSHANDALERNPFAWMIILKPKSPINICLVRETEDALIFFFFIHFSLYLLFHLGKIERQVHTREMHAGLNAGVKLDDMSRRVVLFDFGAS